MENLLGLTASTISFIVWLPQARATWQRRNSPTELAGISLGTQLLVLANAATWGIYAAVNCHDPEALKAKALTLLAAAEHLASGQA